ncbi:feruloyl-CoA synthase [Pseudomaricurvus alkylphenolicus]|uniref:feruloyl-CoA synthase n=1 Tax=Pseudomaricurvus alkylphenolicus TaxID=1306991 RepID=UPI0014233788|nr:feruloyl-CoA synthase [Pseudomaricurvus alkylphenolicus]NIB38733.1 feruloyl-CoA synthase [Pseudomaricurvus alkylphenolicus]
MTTKLKSSVFAPVEVRRTDNNDGSFTLTQSLQLGTYEKSLGAYLRRWATDKPHHIFLGERSDAERWRTLNYSQVLTKVESIAQYYLNIGLSQHKPVMILSENSIDNALLSLAAMYVGIPVAPISSAYSLMSKDFLKLKSVYAQVRPGLVYAGDLERYQRALRALDLSGVTVVSSSTGTADIEAVSIDAMQDTPPGSLVQSSYERVGHDSVAKIMFTSGSTGDPKGVITTQNMMLSNQQAIGQVWPFLTEEAPVLLDWLPWSHTFGGSLNFNMALFNGGSFYIDEGKPLPSELEYTTRNIKDISPTIYMGVPKGFGELIPRLEADDELKAAFCHRLKLVFSAGAAMPEAMWKRFKSTLQDTGDREIPVIGGWGSTETSPMASIVHYPIDTPRMIGVPLPGVELKFIPRGDRFEIRVRGPNVTPGYLNHSEKTDASLDSEQFWIMGDACRLYDDNALDKGIVFDGRLAEEFKLTSGTWVATGALRVNVLSVLSPLAQDVVVTGHDRDYIGVLIFLNQEACQAAITSEHHLDLSMLADNEALQDIIQERLQQYNLQHPASSTRIRRAALLPDIPSFEQGEITDKGYLNQRSILQNRNTTVEALYSGQGSHIIKTD